MLVVPIIYLTHVMIVLRFIQWVDFGVVSSNRTNMVCNNIDHNPYAYVVCLNNKLFELIFTSKVRINGLPVGGPIAMIAILVS